VSSAMLTRVGDEHMGRFVREELARQGVDVSHVRTDPSRLTASVVLGVGAGGDIPHIFFRERCADMGLDADDVDEDFIASARLLAITGTHLSSASTRTAVKKSIRLARRNGTRVLLDIDYRPVLWGLARAGDGASRYVESSEITRVLGDAMRYCDLLVGTEEEIAIAGGSADLLEALAAVRAKTEAVIVLKRGAQGCVVFESGPIPSFDDGLAVPGRDVHVFNTVGAGDGFLAGFLSGWLSGDSWERCGTLGNACGALVVARHGCTPAMPSRIELDAYLARERPPRRPGDDAALAHLHRATTWSDDARPLCVLAFDHRSQFEAVAARHGRPFTDIAEFKNLVADVLLETAPEAGAALRPGAIVDDRYGRGALAKLAETDVWVASPVEVPGSRPLELEPPFATGSHLLGWPAARVVKCLVHYHPDDDPDLRHAQEERIRALHAEVVALERRFLLEVICPDMTCRDGKGGNGALPRALRRLYNLSVRPDWWKLEPQSADGWKAVSSVIADCDPHCKGVLLLGLGADAGALSDALAIAARVPICRGFAIGRSIFADAAEEWFAGTIGDGEARRAIAERYRRLIDVWRHA
ncbi:MAG TPA: PfkB family carbohydrate kinase, partial [Woeseiaceae bacterium]|nr:PfkB family carbohydrate kinase [Woeseiaceae bacterium]